jgi:hypothetical protein
MNPTQQPPSSSQDSPSTPPGRGSTIAVLVICLVGFLVSGWLLTRQQEFWSPDSSLRFVQVASFARHGFAGGSVSYPAASIDPEGRFFPAGPWFHFARGERQYLAYLPYFPLLTSPLYRALGFPGLLVLPMLAGLAAVWATYLVLGRLSPDLAVWGMLALGLGSPLLVYSAVFWDHSLVAALGAGALALAAVSLDDPGGPRSRVLFAAGALAGLGLWLRNEMYPLAAIIVAAWFVFAPCDRTKTAAALAAGVVAAGTPLWLLNIVLQGQLLGWKGQGLAASRAADVAGAVGERTLFEYVTDRWSNAYFQLISPDFYAFNPQAVKAGLAAAAGMLFAALLLYLGMRRHSRWGVLFGGLVGAGVTLAVISGRPSVSGLLLAVPVVILAALGGRLRRWEWFLWVVVTVFVAVIVATGTHGGMQWGPRYLMPVVPAAVWLAAAAVDRAGRRAPEMWPVIRFTAAAMLAAGFLVQAAGVDYVEQKVNLNVRANQAIRAAPSDVVVTSLEWLAVGAGRAHFEKRLLLVDSIEEFQALIRRLSENRVARWTYIPRSGYEFGAWFVEQWSAGEEWSYKVAEDRHVSGIRLVTYAGPEAPR